MTVQVGRQLVLRADHPSVVASGPIVGREQELITLRRALRESEIDGRSIVIGGDAGLGKTALLNAFRADVRRDGVTVVEGSCVEIESRRPFGAFADVIASCERTFGTERVARSLGERGIQLRQLMSPGVKGPRAENGDRYQMHSANLGLFGDLTRDGPLAIFVEDLHWADTASLELFGYLARRLRGLPVLLVATYRTDELDRLHPLRAVLAELGKARLVEIVPLAPLDKEGTGALICSRLALRDAAIRDTREFADLIHARCEGNPLHTEETLDTLRRSGRLRYAEGAWVCDVDEIKNAIPASVAEGVVARWTALSRSTQQVILTASVIGHRFDLDLLANALDTTSSALAPSIHEAIDARLVLEDTTDRPLAFRHALTREALRQQLLHSERVALHAKVAASLERRREKRAVPAAELAYHLEESGNRPGASHFHEAAAEEAAAATDYNGAARSMERAIALSDASTLAAGQRHITLMRYLRQAGDDERAARATEAALDIARTVGDAYLEGLALLELWKGGYRNSEEVPAREQLDRARAVLEPLGPTAALADTYSALAGVAGRKRDGADSVVWARRAREIALELRLPAQLALSTQNMSIGLFALGEHTEAIATCRDAIKIARDAELSSELWAALQTLRVQLFVADGPAQEQRDAESELRAATRELGHVRQEWMVRELDSMCGDADWDGFVKLFAQLPDPLRSDAHVPNLTATLISIARNGPASAELDVAKLVADYSYSAPSAAWAARVLLLAGRAADAVTVADAVRDEVVRTRYWGLAPASNVHAIGLFAARACGDTSARERFVRSLLEVRPLPVVPTFNRRNVALAEADIAESAGRLSDALDAYARVLLECERSQYADRASAYLVTLVRQRRAKLLLQITPPDRAIAQHELDALLPYWLKAKATWYLGELKAWAQELGLLFPESGLSGATASSSPRRLTRRELEVARLVGQGLTNREIGKRLTLSVRTAESHVEQIRSKLGFHTRAQIATWITERYGSVHSS